MASLVKRKDRVRSSLKKNNKSNRPRLVVYRSNLHIYAQIICDIEGKTLASASTLDKSLKLKATSNVKAAEEVGKSIAASAKKLKLSKVVFDRGGYLYHGRVKAVAEAARAGGLDF